MRHLAFFAAGALLVLAGCSNAARDVALTTEAPVTEVTAAPTVPAPSEAVPSAAASSEPPMPQPTEAEPVAQGREVELWFIRDRPSFTLEPEMHRLPAPTQAVAREALELLVTSTPQDPALASAIPHGTKILDVSLTNEMLTVDVQFPSEGLHMGAGYESALFSQIIHTGAQFETVRRVLILEEGRTPETPHGVILDEPRKPDEYEISPVVIMEPRHGETVDAGSVTVSGTANVYEANVVLRLIDPDGTTVEKTFTTATCGTGCRGTWEHTFTDVTTPGQWTVVAGASDPSGGAEGYAPYKVRRTFTVR